MAITPDIYGDGDLVQHGTPPTLEEAARDNAGNLVQYGEPDQTQTPLIQYPWEQPKYKLMLKKQKTVEATRNDQEAFIVEHFLSESLKQQQDVVGQLQQTRQGVRDVLAKPIPTKQPTKIQGNEGLAGLLATILDPGGASQYADAAYNVADQRNAANFEAETTADNQSRQLAQFDLQGAEQDAKAKLDIIEQNKNDRIKIVLERIKSAGKLSAGTADDLQAAVINGNVGQVRFLIDQHNRLNPDNPMPPDIEKSMINRAMEVAANKNAESAATAHQKESTAGLNETKAGAITAKLPGELAVLKAKGELTDAQASYYSMRAKYYPKEAQASITLKTKQGLAAMKNAATAEQNAKTNRAKADEATRHNKQTEAKGFMDAASKDVKTATDLLKVEGESVKQDINAAKERRLLLESEYEKTTDSDRKAQILKEIQDATSDIRTMADHLKSISDKSVTLQRQNAERPSASPSQSGGKTVYDINGNPIK